MKILFFSHYFSPHIGGVEKHVLLLSRELIQKGHEVTIVTEKFSQKLKSREIVDGINVIRFNYPKRKFIGIIYIWHFLWLKCDLLWQSDVIHIHDVFIWYLPFRFLFPKKKVFVTIHGLEWGNPLSEVGIWQKKLAVKLSSGSIGVGKFIEKYTGVKFTKLIYGAVNLRGSSTGLRMTRQAKRKNAIVFVGRLEKDTGVLRFLDWLSKNPGFSVRFVGDGSLRHKCEEFGKVNGFSDPARYFKNAEYAVPGGYLACLEAMSYRCKVKIFWQDDLKKDYWQLSPMYKFIVKEDVRGAFEWVKKQSWENLTKEYINLWKI